jgi:hypothetical protein
MLPLHNSRSSAQKNKLQKDKFTPLPFRTFVRIIGFANKCSEDEIMDVKKQGNTLARVEKSLRASYRRFLDIEDETIVMPLSQLRLFTEQAYRKHLLVAIQFANQHQVLGFVNHKLNDDTFVLREYGSNLSQIVRIAQCTYVKRCD